MTALVFIALLSLLVLVHELGHYLAARYFGITVDEFGIGIPPRALKLFKKGKTLFTLNWLPLGGFVRLRGEERPDDKGDHKKSKSYFYARSRGVRAAVLSSGVVFNFILGILLFSLVYSYIGVPNTVGENVVVAGVSEGSPADLSSIEEGDVFVRVGDREVEGMSSFVELIDERRGEEVTVYVGRIQGDGGVSDTLREVSVIPRVDPPEGEGALGISIVSAPEIVHEKKPWYLAPFYGVAVGVQEAYYWGRAVVYGLTNMFVGLFSGVVPSDVAGPVGIYQATSQVAQSGVIALIRFAAILSINLGIFNLLPIPALDGGRLLFVLIESVFGRDRLNKVERYAHMLGFISLILLLIVITWKDVLRLLSL